MTIVFNRINDKSKRRQLRHGLSDPESKLWSCLRNRQLQNCKFRRQYSIGRYVADFYCSDLKLVIEIDGDSHFTEEGQKYDKQRTSYFHSLGLRVIRFTNQDVTKNLDGVLEAIVGALITSPPPSPS